MIYGIIFVVCVVLAWRWVNGLDFMKDFHLDYEGEDFL